MIFAKCPRIMGDVNLIDGLPELRTVYNCVVEEWALYDGARRLVPQSGFYRGVPHLQALGGSQVTKFHPGRAPLSMECYKPYYIGRISDHFGHFLTSTLSRLWPFAGYLAPQTPIVCHGMARDQMFEVEFMRECFAALGIIPDQIIAIDPGLPMYFPEMIVADGLLYENYQVYSGFADYMFGLARELAPDPPHQSGRPAYISRAKVATRIRNYPGEDVLAEKLEGYGFEIVSPETISFRDQVAFWRQERPIVGFASSALHMSALAGNKNIIEINYSDHAGTNQILIDVAVRNETLRIYPPGGLRRLEPSDGAEMLEIIDPVRMAEDLVTLYEHYFILNSVKPQRMAPEPRTLDPRAVINDPFGLNLALQGKASQSSNYGGNEGENISAGGAISGHLTGHHQCHTAEEDSPWWQVEFPEFSAIYDIRVYNRIDDPGAQARLNNLRILSSRDGEIWHLVAERQEAGMVGDGGHPYRVMFSTGLVARFIRLQLTGFTVLHFDQVEIFGEPAEAIWLGDGLDDR